MPEKKVTIKEFKSMIGLPWRLEDAFDRVTQWNDTHEMTYEESKDLVQDWIKFIDDWDWDREWLTYYSSWLDWLKENMRAMTEKPERECKTIRDMIQALYCQQEDEEIYEVKPYLEERLELQEEEDLSDNQTTEWDSK